MKLLRQDRIAYHEAGHAVIGLWLGLPVDRVWMDRSGRNGECSIAHAPKWYMNLSRRGSRRYSCAIKVTREEKAYIRRLIMWGWGGPVAESELLQDRRPIRTFWCGLSEDRVSAFADASLFVAPGKHRRYIASLEGPVREIVRSLWPAIEVVAARLLKRRMVGVRLLHRLVLQSSVMESCG